MTKTIRISKVSHDILKQLQWIEPTSPSFSVILDRILKDEYQRKLAEIQAYQKDMQEKISEAHP